MTELRFIEHMSLADVRRVYWKADDTIRANICYGDAMRSARIRRALAGARIVQLENGEVPSRVQLSRKGGFRLSDNTVSVARPHKWGNPFKVETFKKDRFCKVTGSTGTDTIYEVVAPNGDWMHRSPVKAEAINFAVNAYEAGLTALRDYKCDSPGNGWRIRRDFITEIRMELGGKNLACWCPLPEPVSHMPKPGDAPRCRCHADVLLKFAGCEVI